MLPKVFYDKEDHECPGNQNQPDHGKLLCGGRQSRRRFFWPDQDFSDLWSFNHFKPTLTFSSDLLEVESALLSTQ
jgi:hypothetical protein